MKRHRFLGFKKCMEMMRSRRPLSGQIKEEGFHELLPHAGEYVHELMDEFAKDQNMGLRCWILELLGEAKAVDSLDFLAGQLRAEEPALRSSARWALDNINTKEARTRLWEARAFLDDTPASDKR